MNSCRLSYVLIMTAANQTWACSFWFMKESGRAPTCSDPFNSLICEVNEDLSYSIACIWIGVYKRATKKFKHPIVESKMPWPPMSFGNSQSRWTEKELEMGGSMKILILCYSLHQWSFQSLLSSSTLDILPFISLFQELKTELETALLTWQLISSW